MRRLVFFACLLLILVSSAWLPAIGQQPCPMPRTLRESEEHNLFSPQQEMWLGEAVAEQFERDFRVIRDDSLTVLLNHLGTRIASHLPEPKPRFQFFLVDLPVANAFALPGGRIYVTRKLVAFAGREDELAGVLGHEMGHVISGETARNMSEAFRIVLGVTQVSDRDDIFEKYHRLIENVARQGKAFRRSNREAQHGQITADLVALYAVALAGYDPQAFTQFWDRFAETQGKTGNWFSDLFGATRPESKRLREMLKEAGEIPLPCRGIRPKSTAEDFQMWQAAVIAYAGLGRGEQLPGLRWKRPLAPPLQGEVRRIRFSPDGRYLLVQDDASIFLLTRDPLVTLFRIDAEDANPAEFTSDSGAIVFRYPSLRVEHWDIEQEQRIGVYELHVAGGCLQALLSTDGKILACLDAQLNLRLIDVPSGSELYRRESFVYPGDYLGLWLIIALQELLEQETNLIQMAFSPDMRYFLAAHPRDSLALDLSTRQPVRLPGSIKQLLAKGFAFLGPDRLVGIHESDYKKSAVVRFPSGEEITRLALAGTLAAPAHGDYVLVRGAVKDYAVGALDLRTSKFVAAHKKPVLDIYDDVFARERNDGEISLYHIQRRDPVAHARLPRSPLGRLQAAAISPDFRWLAVSERGRGAVWDLGTGERIFHSRGFRGAWFDEQSVLHADFPEFEESPRMIGLLDPRHRQTLEDLKIEEPRLRQYGSLLVQLRSAKKDGDLDRNVILEVRDVNSGNVLWSLPFPAEAPDYYVSEGVVLVSSLESKTAREAVNRNPRLQKSLSALAEKRGAYLVRVLELDGVRERGSFLLDTGKGSFRIRDVRTVADWVAVSDDQNRVLLYSLSTGQQIGRVFGRRPALSLPRGWLCVESEPGELALYDLRSLSKRNRFLFSAPVSLVAFTSQGELFVVTANQNAYLLDPSPTESTQK